MHLRPLAAFLWLFVPLTALAASDDPPAPHSPPASEKQPIEHEAASADAASPKQDSGPQNSGPSSPTSEFRLNPLGDFFHDLHRALGGRKATSSVNTPGPPTLAADPSDSAYQPFQLIPTSGNLLGDWWGARTWLEDRGITTSLSFVTNLAGNVSGGMDQGFTHADNLGLDLNFDLEKILGIDGASFLLNMSQRSGSSVSQVYIGNVFTVQQVFGGTTFHLIDAAWQQQLFNDALSFRIGRIAAGDDFIVSEFNYLFMQNGFCGNPVGIFFNSPGMTAYPNATWGAVATWKATQRFSIMAGIYNGDPNIRANNYNGVNFSLNGPLFAMAELHYQLNGLDSDSGPVGNYKLGFWYDNSVYADFVGGAASRGNYGFYGLFDQLLIPFGDRKESRGLGITGSALFSPDESVSTMPYFFTAGVVARGMFEARPDDVAGLGFIYGNFSNDLQTSQRAAQLFNPAQGVQTYESVIEATYRIALPGNSVFVQPDLQYIIRPGGTGQFGNALVLGCQIGINF
ncbi:MAG: carbohydrate porin [Phycisphaerae bacterium]|nr:carbohydrate porin [Phycisphaerae bacterium]